MLRGHNWSKFVKIAFNMTLGRIEPMQCNASFQIPGNSRFTRQDVPIARQKEDAELVRGSGLQGG
jgi:hypothetical protein